MIKYRFLLQDDTAIELEVDETRGSTPPAPAAPPAWTRLEPYRCDHCPLPDDQALCPAAQALLPVVEAFGHRVSFESLRCQVQLGAVTFEAEVPTQDAVRSLVGLLLALSDCPTMSRLKPMAYFHLPFASHEHTVFRVFGTYLTAQYLRHIEGLEPDWELDGLRRLYSDLHKVNVRLAERLRVASEGDASVNSMVMLDTLAHAVDTGFAQNLERLRPLFATYLEDV